MRRNGFHNNQKKERIIMTASAVFVLAALTMTGIYVKQSGRKSGDDGYTIDFSALEDAVDETKNDIKGGVADSGTPGQNLINMDDDLDYFPPLTEADSDEIKIPGLTAGENTDGDKKSGTGNTGSGSTGSKKNTGSTGASQAGQDTASESAGQETLEQQTLADEAAMAADAANDQGVVENTAGEAAEGVQEQAWEDPAAPAAVQGEVVSSFGAGDSLVWPISGTVLINYSADRTVYFATLKAYKCNPGIVMSAAEGDTITAAASGVVKEVFYNEEIGNAVRIDIGRGYEAIYGQLKDIQVSAGSTVEVGTVLGYIAAPTKYFRVEGCNAYFALEKDGQPVDPLGQLQ